ncbi:hypothetical protein ACFL59_05745 [Planctomycetota bacterium]
MWKDLRHQLLVIRGMKPWSRSANGKGRKQGLRGLPTLILLATTLGVLASTQPADAGGPKYVLALRGEAKSKRRLTHAKRFNDKAKAPRPGMYVEEPQPFISLQEIWDKKVNTAEFDRKTFDKLAKEHAKSSQHSYFVSFTGLKEISKEDPGFQAQDLWLTNKKEKTWKKSFLTTKLNLTSINRHSSGNEKEILLRGHLHRADKTLMQHMLKKTGKKKFTVKSREWDPKKFKWEKWGKETSYETVTDGLFHMVEVGYDA